jgi:hypothetical protein
LCEREKLAERENKMKYVLVAVVVAIGAHEAFSKQPSGEELQKAIEKCWSFPELDESDLGECVAAVLAGEL